MRLALSSRRYCLAAAGDRKRKVDAGMAKNTPLDSSLGTTLLDQMGSSLVLQSQTTTQQRR